MREKFYHSIIIENGKNWKGHVELFKANNALIERVDGRDYLQKGFAKLFEISQ